MSLIFILGGARSGKSRFALRLCEDQEAVVFIATALPLDSEMEGRIERHRSERPSYWKTIEEPVNLLKALKDASDSPCIIIDCLTMWVSNLLERYSDDEIVELAKELSLYSKGLKCAVIAVSNEVGLGIVPEYPLGRRYRDLLGKVNQIFAENADKVFFMIAGIPLELKNESK